MSGDTKKRLGWLKGIAIAVVLLVVIIIVLPFVVDANQFRPQIQSRLTSALGRDVKVGKLKLSLLSGSLAVDDIAIADNPAFSNSPFVTAKSLNVGIELKPLIFSKEIRVTGISLEQPYISLIRSSTGKWNFSDLGSKAETGGEKPTESTGSIPGAEVLIKQLKITNGRITSTEGRRKPSVYDNVNITVSNLSFTTSFPFTLTASIPGGGSLKLEGKAGPLNKTDALMTPLAADLAVTHFDMVGSGFVPADSGLAGILDFNGTVTSDAGQAQSKGHATAEKLQLVKGGAPAGRPISLDYDVNYDMPRQSGILREAKVQYGKAVATLGGQFKILEDNTVLSLKLRGSDMPVQDLAALLPAFGVTLPKGASLQGGSLNADLTTEGPLEKLVTAGTAEISNTKLVGFDLAGKLATLATLAGIRPSQETEIERFSTGMQMTPQGIEVKNLLLIMPALGELSGLGKIAPDQSLDFTMRAMLKPSGGIGAGLARLTQSGSLNIPFFVRGTASDPKFIPDIKNAAGSLLGSTLTGSGSQGGQSGAGGALGDALRGLFNKKKK